MRYSCKLDDAIFTIETNLVISNADPVSNFCLRFACLITGIITAEKYFSISIWFVLTSKKNISSFIFPIRLSKLPTLKCYSCGCTGLFNLVIIGLKAKAESFACFNTHVFACFKHLRNTDLLHCFKRRCE